MFTATVNQHKGNGGLHELVVRTSRAHQVKCMPHTSVLRRRTAGIELDGHSPLRRFPTAATTQPSCKERQPVLLDIRWRTTRTRTPRLKCKLMDRSACQGLLTSRQQEPPMSTPKRCGLDQTATKSQPSCTVARGDPPRRQRELQPTDRQTSSRPLSMVFHGGVGVKVEERM